jgi:hypothetical protein
LQQDPHFRNISQYSIKVSVGNEDNTKKKPKQTEFERFDELHQMRRALKINSDKLISSDELGNQVDATWRTPKQTQ